MSQGVLDAIVSTEGVVRSATLISLATQVAYRVLPLVRAAANGTSAPSTRSAPAASRPDPPRLAKQP